MPTELDPFDRLRPSEPDDPDDAVPVARPRPGHPLVVRLHERAEPWVAWFGVRRLVGSAITIVVVIAAGWWLLRAPPPPTEAVLPRAAAGASTPSIAPAPVPRPSAPPSTTPASVVVHVAGAVNAPGVYALAPGARAGDAVALAGGAAAGADVDALNLAASLRDGERVYVPVVGEAVPPPVDLPDAPGVSVAPGPVDLNRATVTELDALPGVGPATAHAIVSHRDANGPFASVDDLEQVRGIGPAKLEAIRPLVTL